MTLTEFMTARLDEMYAEVDIYHDARCTTHPCGCGLPEWLRADIAAKRATIAATEQAWGRSVADDPNPEGSEWLLGHRWGLREACQHLASVYADHEDYQQEWAPRA